VKAALDVLQRRVPFAPKQRPPDNRTMSRHNDSSRTTLRTEYQKRIARAAELGSEYIFAAEILHFYISIVRFQEKLSKEILRSAINGNISASDQNAFAQPLPLGITSQFNPFLSVVEENGPETLRESARELRDRGEDSHLQLLTSFWKAETGAMPPGSYDFLARAFLQPYAEYCRSQAVLKPSGPTPYICPVCRRKPGLGVLRPLGDGGQRSLVCSFCLAEWEFRRILCPGCGEENHVKLPVYTAEELKHVRVEACDSCRTYIKTVDLTKSGRAEPVVDELASIPLDLWADKQGYTKLQPNLMQL
jgi:FdhE protein